MQFMIMDYPLICIEWQHDGLMEEDVHNDQSCEEVYLNNFEDFLYIFEDFAGMFALSNSWGEIYWASGYNHTDNIVSRLKTVWVTE